MVDDFEGRNLNKALVEYTAQDSHVIVLIGGPGVVSTTLLTGNWGSYATASTTGLRMTAALLDPAATIIADTARYGVQWSFETPMVDAGMRTTIDVSAATGLAFWARLAAPPTSCWKGKLKITIPIPQSLPASQGGDGTCDPANAATDKLGCYAHPTFVGSLTKQCWSLIKIPWAGFKVPYGGDTTLPANWQKTIMGVEFQFSDYDAASISATFPVDLIIDDLFFY
jgi:hypothetical protein